MRVVVALLMLVCVTASALAQETIEQALAAGDAARSSGDRDAARAAYERALAIDPESSRATFHLAALQPAGSDAAIALFGRYVALEPDDLWGWAALAEAHVEAGDADEALAAYARALSIDPSERSVAIARIELLVDLDRRTEAIAALEEWTARRGDDLEAWRLLARVHRRAGDVDGEIATLERIAALDPQDPSSERLRALEARSAPALQPSFGVATDSDGSSLTRTAIAGDVAVGDRTRMGLHVERATASGDGTATVDRGLLYFTARGDDGFLFDARGGIAMREDAKGQLARSIEPVGRVRARWSGSGDAIGLELRAQRSLQDASTTLIENGIVLEEALVSVELPAGGVTRVRVLAAGGALGDGGKRNWRVRAAGGPFFEVQPGLRVGVQYDGTMYTGRSTKGYFAPALAHTLEATAYGEIEDRGGLAIAGDVGAGVQQIVEEKGAVGTIQPALRGWGSIGWSFAPSSSLGLELEAYNVIGGGGVARGAGGWSYLSASLALRVAF